PAPASVVPARAGAMRAGWMRCGGAPSPSAFTERPAPRWPGGARPPRAATTQRASRHRAAPRRNPGWGQQEIRFFEVMNPFDPGSEVSGPGRVTPAPNQGESTMSHNCPPTVSAPATLSGATRSAIDTLTAQTVAGLSAAADAYRTAELSAVATAAA